jgi:hypothetical protein
MEEIVVINGLSQLGAADVQAWQQLFAQCFKKSPLDAEFVFRKYELHAEKVWMCLARKDGRLAACYSGIALPFGTDKVLLATDTMSNGEISGATVKMAKTLYPALANAGINAVCGYPNGNIIRIRERKLGWKMVGQLHLYVGMPFLWRFGLKPATVPALWDLSRPPRGFFSATKAPLTLLGRQGPYKGGLFTATLASARPGPFFFRIPARLVAPKNFGFALTRPDAGELAHRLEIAAGHLDLNTIDVP